ncbi:MAG TPA: hypothetical protein VF483_04355 [Gemmatimonadaceae bacterium]
MRFLSAVAVASLLAAGTVQAQGSKTANPACTGLAGDTCQQAVDFFYYMTPQLGTAMTGANTTLAQGGALGGMRFGFMPRFAIDARVNVVLGNIPNFSPAAGAPAAKSMTAKSGMIPMPAIDVALGVFKGVPLGVTNVGGVDLLASAIYVPKINNSDFTLTPASSLSMGYGVRVGLLQEGLVSPGVGFSFIKRAMPATDLGSTQGSATFTVNKLDLSSSAWRLTVSKSLLLFGLAVGYGQDSYKSSIGSISAQNGVTTVSTPALKNDMKRTNMFADLSMNLFVMKIVASGGIVSGGDMATFNTYDNAANKSRPYGSVGVRFGL